MDNPASPETYGSGRKSARFLPPAILSFILIFGTAAGIYFWNFSNQSCEVRVVQEASSFLVTQRNTYDEAYQFATTVSRNSLEHPVNTLEFILMDTQDVAAPACMQTAKDELIDCMGTVNRAFGAYAAGGAAQAVWDLIGQAETHYNNFAAELATVNERALLCVPLLSRRPLK